MFLSEVIPYHFYKSETKYVYVFIIEGDCNGKCIISNIRKYEYHFPSLILIKRIVFYLVFLTLLELINNIITYLFDYSNKDTMNKDTSKMITKNNKKMFVNLENKE